MHPPDAEIHSRRNTRMDGGSHPGQQTVYVTHIGGIAVADGQRQSIVREYVETNTGQR